VILNMLSPTAGEASTAFGPAARVLFTTRRQGDMSPAADGRAAESRAALTGVPWTALRQVHGAGVRVVKDRSEADRIGYGVVPGDGLVTAATGVALTVLTADCAPVAFYSPEGVIGVAHAGWRGLAAGVIGATAAAMRELGATELIAAVGPCIHVECYQFGQAELDGLESLLGPSVRGVDIRGRPALDLPAAVSAALRGAGVGVQPGPGVCTACSAEHWSWRARADPARQATVVWRS